MHLLTAGTDADHTAFRLGQAVVVAAVVSLTIYRIIAARTRGSAPRTLTVEESVHVDEVDTGERRELAA